MIAEIQDIEVEFEPKRLLDFRNMRKLFELKDGGDLSLFDKWGVDVFGSEQWDGMLDAFAEKHDGFVSPIEWVGFINEIILSAKESGEEAKNS